MSIEDAKALFSGIKDGISYDWWEDFLVKVYTSDDMSYWRAMTEKETSFGDEEIDAVLNSWLGEEKGTILSDAIGDLANRWDVHGFKNGFSFAMNFLRQIDRYKTRGEEFGKICHEKELKEWQKMMAGDKGAI